MADTQNMSSNPSSRTRKDAVLSRRYIEGQIADGKHIIIYDNRVLKVDAWIKFHPGGDKSIKHMVGRDATDEINAFHSKEARQRMPSFQIGRIQGTWSNFLPPIQGGKFRPYTGEPCSSDEDTTDHETSRPPSPVFDAAEAIKEAAGVRRRRKSTSLSDTSVSTTPGEELESKPFFLDARTQEEIVNDMAKYPSLHTTSQENIKQKYRELDERIRAEGLYECNYSSYLIECCRYTLLGCLSYMFLRSGWYVTSAFFLGCVWHQLVFTAHDAGHTGITHRFHVDAVIGIIIADYLGGLSIGWWKRNHNVHHIVTNAPEHDPDIEHMPFFAISHRFLLSLRSTYYERVMQLDAMAKFMLQYQHYLYYIILLFGRFNLYRLSWVYLLGGQAPKKGPAWWHRWLELGGQVFFWYWFGYAVLYRSIPDWGNRIAFLLVSHMVTAPLHLQITLSHFAMSTADLGVHESFPQKQLRTTMDVDCPTWLDFFHGGLQFQAIHHLYPQIPRHNLRRTQKLVIEFCRDTGIPYTVFTFYGGNKEVIGRLGDVAKQLRILKECRKSYAGQGVLSDHH
ncbi:fatty acid desaturase [Aspergillus clavatus NRRL 1]|uniref:Delta 8-(E)-sphingolipid desaturase n=1 Tax=Aspergillus clavatus (strain ATCC 1007 / CBS 513.65 / DSM 816 / NCTC 3887 / NRRL 1 / QM 1276 / 107) TaxID=344612 RepID=A1CFC2_ASPCL|nr:fatty acid desaturase, putative [Aspergillus clavatus NRRL 1]EAW11571.1 fatty acid desaturase, putative [Aspergillus clavatus NRRL 1]